jgi:hypothetical protein
MSKLSRRSLVASAASLPALAAPVVAGAMPGEADVELKQLGVRLLKANRDLDAVFAKPHFPDKEVDDAMGRIAALMPPIFSLIATTRDGLAVQAAAAASACRELWDDAGDWSTAEHPSWKVERPFLEAVCRYTGVAHPIVPDQPEKTPWLVHSAEPDPIFALLEAHRAAVAAFSEASKQADGIPFNERTRALARVVVGYDADGELIKGADAEGPFFRWKNNGKKNPIYAHSTYEIEQKAPKELDEQTREAWIDERTQELVKEEERVRNEKLQTEHGRLEAVSNTAADREWNLIHELMGTLPTTSGGLAALLSYVRTDRYVREQVIGFGNDLSTPANLYLWTMERLACAAAGLPEPPKHEGDSLDDDV